MKIEGVRVVMPKPRAPEPGSAGHEWSAVDYMLNVREGVHDRQIAKFLGVASAWVYADIDTFVRVMHERGGLPRNETVGITNTNPVLFADTTAYLSQSEDKRLAILTFRGTGMSNLTNWLTDAAVAPDPFLTAGYAHGGFYRAALVLWRTLEGLLLDADKGSSICESAIQERAKVRDCVQEVWWTRLAGRAGAEKAVRGRKPDMLRHLAPPPTAAAPGGLQGLYITGHSLGGAIAVIAAALIQMFPKLASIRKKLLGVYTYGQPMVGQQDFNTRFEKEFGHKLFRHVYGKDIVPCLPSITAGRFGHFGSEYASSDSGWMPRSKAVTQARTILGSSIIGLTAFLQKQLTGVPILAKIPTPFSWLDHAPINYLRTSQAIAPGAEFV